MAQVAEVAEVAEVEEEETEAASKNASVDFAVETWEILNVQLHLDSIAIIFFIIIFLFFWFLVFGFGFCFLFCVALSNTATTELNDGNPRKIGGKSPVRRRNRQASEELLHLHS